MEFSNTAEIRKPVPITEDKSKISVPWKWAGKRVLEVKAICDEETDGSLNDVVDPAAFISPSYGNVGPCFPCPTEDGLVTDLVIPESVQQPEGKLQKLVTNEGTKSVQRGNHSRLFSQAMPTKQYQRRPRFSEVNDDLNPFTVQTSKTDTKGRASSLPQVYKPEEPEYKYKYVPLHSTKIVKSNHTDGRPG